MAKSRQHPIARTIRQTTEYSLQDAREKGHSVCPHAEWNGNLVCPRYHRNSGKLPAGRWQRRRTGGIASVGWERSDLRFVMLSSCSRFKPSLTDCSSRVRRSVPAIARNGLARLSRLLNQCSLVNVLKNKCNQSALPTLKLPSLELPPSGPILSPRMWRLAAERKSDKTAVALVFKLRLMTQPRDQRFLNDFLSLCSHHFGSER